MTTQFIIPEIEDSILGTIILNPELSMPWAASSIHPEDFGMKINSDIWKMLLGMEVEQKPITLSTFHVELQSAGLIGSVPAHRMFEIRDAATAPSTLQHMLELLREKRALRTLFAGVSDVMAQMLTPSADAGLLMAQLAECIDCAGKARARASTAKGMAALVWDAVERIQARNIQSPDQAGVPTGLAVLDRETGGMLPGATWVIAGPSKGGKSMLALNLLQSASVQHGRRCLFFGLEMPAIDNVERMISSEGCILASSLRDGTLSAADFMKLAATGSKLKNAPIQFRDDVFDLTEMMQVAKQYKLAYPDLFAVFVDYAQLVGADAIRGANREQEVAQVSTALRRLAMQEKLCVVVLSQLNDDGKLRESRRLGMDATVIATIEDEDEPKVKRVKLIQRNGRQCTIRLAYRGEFMRFDSLSDGESYPKKEDPEQKTQPRYRSRQADH